VKVPRLLSGEKNVRLHEHRQVKEGKEMKKVRFENLSGWMKFFVWITFVAALACLIALINTQVAGGHWEKYGCVNETYIDFSFTRTSDKLNSDCFVGYDISDRYNWVKINNSCIDSLEYIGKLITKETCQGEMWVKNK
jgi:hypothetical protein